MQMWLELYSTPGDKEMGILEQVIQSWFIVGRVGGYDATNLQVQLATYARARVACVFAAMQTMPCRCIEGADVALIVSASALQARHAPAFEHK
jgi:Protein of unknown function (DUF3531)